MLTALRMYYIPFPQVRHYIAVAGEGLLFFASSNLIKTFNSPHARETYLFRCDCIQSAEFYSFSWHDSY